MNYCAGGCGNYHYHFMLIPPYAICCIYVVLLAFLLQDDVLILKSCESLEVPM